MPEPTPNDFELIRVERFLKDGQKSLARFGVQADYQIRQGEILESIQAQMQLVDYDLIVLGAPLPDRAGHFELEGVIKSILTTIENSSFLIVRSHQLQRLQDSLRRIG